MKIIYLYDAIYPYIRGGGEKTIYEISKRLSKKGYRVKLLGIKWWEGPDTIVRDGVEISGVYKRCKLYTTTGRRSIKEAIIFGIYSFFSLLKEDFDIIDAAVFPYFSVISAKLVCLLKRKKLVVTWYEVWDNYWYKYLGKLGVFGKLIERFVGYLPDIIITLSDYTAERLVNILGIDRRRIFICGGGIDYKKILSITRDCIKKYDIIFIGRFIPEKNIELIINTVKELKKNKADVSCILIGDGPELPRIRKIVKKYGLDKNIFFKGFITEEDKLYRYLGSGKVFLIPSKREGFGIVAIEANAAGLPVITINHPDSALPSLIKNGKNGFIVEEDPVIISEKIKQLLEDEKNYRYISQNARISAKNYDWDNIIKRLEYIYAQIHPSCSTS